MKYIIGLDMGITSVGFSTMMLDEQDEPCRILRMGSRIFEAAEHPKDGSSLAAPRRENRSMRRRLRRKRHRKERIRSLIVNNGVMTAEQIDNIYDAKNQLSDIYQVRTEALDRRLSTEEFVRLLIHLSQRRGFKSNRKVDAQEKKSEAGKLLNAVSANHQLMLEKGYRTVGEMLYRDEKFSAYKRNKADDYSNTFARSEYEDEIRAIFRAQQELGNPHATDKLMEDYLAIYLSQRSFDEGPGGKSPYAGNQIEKMIGKCTLEPNEKRAAKASYSFEYFNLLSKVNSIKIVCDGEKRALNDAERQTVIQLAFSKNAINYTSIRKALHMTDSERFNISYSQSDKTADEIEKKTKFTYLTAFHTFKKAYGNAYVNWQTEKKNRLAYALTAYRNDSSIVDYLSENGFDKAETEIALTLPTFTKWGNLSEKALNKIIPYLEQGMLYHDACTAAGYNFKADDTEKRMYLPAHEKEAPELEDIKNPVVRRAISQTIKVVNALIRERGESPCFVNIELARELSKNKADRNKIEKSQKENQANNDRIMERLKNEFGLLSPTGQDLVKLKLWEEQDGKCPYSLKPIRIERLFEPGYTDIDHIIPYSLCFDDTYNNKVLVMSSENRQKSNRIPMQYLEGKRRDDFRVWVENSHLRYRKKQNLLKETLTEDDLSGFKKRNLQDTQYLSSFMLKYLKKYLALSPNSTGRKNAIQAVKGSATAYMRKRWGIQKIRENGDIHHAVDAVVIACVTSGMTQRISQYAKYKETKYQNPDTGAYFDVDKRTGEVIDRFPTPYQWFRDELLMRCSDDPSRVLHEKPLPNYATDEQVAPIFVSRMPKHKAKGSAHKETIRKPYKQDGQKYTISKAPLNTLKLKNGEIENYFNPGSDTLLYDALKERLVAFGGDAKKAFEAPFHKPKSDGTPGPVVKKVKLIDKATITVPVQRNTAVADNGSMVRVDVFYVEGEGYYLVPIYVADTVGRILPNRAIVAYKPHDEWKEMNEDDFVFSLYPNDLVRIRFSKEMKFSLSRKDSTLPDERVMQEGLFYYRGTNISTGAIGIINHDNTYVIRGLGVKRLPLMEKYQVDVLGNISKIGKEKRMRFK
ncbi:type II CRISPR RNA-guided endonuclease Cas9 [Ruminococcus difficilis]|uniref:CRISPR-associated endonuclease Cas9 n=1 Tax=Ruminococcus difficilis TaxID=2763069 RepID=A0A934TZA4_9FIRM|nr:type II CRISPR RNA-guided endonuclease Cas9 [Ruminococcus difficilis]MBK6087583.1 type II CRISPR RNA-guided endonuclease Cas9 [Ruminococcus difficilis]